MQVADVCDRTTPSSGLRLQPEPLVLASASPRRADLLRESGYRFTVVPALVNEPWLHSDDIPTEAFAEAVAYFKARSVAALHTDSTILAADTVVAIGDRRIGKPRDADDARRILSRLSASRHRVVTGVAIIGPGNVRRMIRHDVTVLDMRKLTPEELDAYIVGGEWRDKAGAYAIQESGDRFVTLVQGSFSNVVGLPLELLETMWKDWFEQERRRFA